MELAASHDAHRKTLGKSIQPTGPCSRLIELNLITSSWDRAAGYRIVRDQSARVRNGTKRAGPPSPNCGLRQPNKAVSERQPWGRSDANGRACCLGTGDFMEQQHGR